MPSLTISAIYIYPIKSLGGISLDAAQVEEKGLQYDRRWLLVDANNQFLSQRTYPQMALLKVKLTPEGLLVEKKGTGSFVVPYQPQTTNTLTVQVWDDSIEGVEVSPEADKWFTEMLGMDCKLVYMPEQTIRPVDEQYAVADNYVSFADAYPFLLIGQSSLDDLNSRMSESLPMNRFRPNLVVQGAAPFAEDEWYEIRIGECSFYVVKPCARCVLTTVDQETAQKGKEPLKTLATYRTIRNKIMFGQNIVFGRKGNRIQVGDLVEVVSTKVEI
jgi:hypothetical protein